MTKYKLTSVNVPETFYQMFLQPLSRGTSAITDRLRRISPTRRGAGQTRVIKDVTQEQWNDLYIRAATARQSIVGAVRKTELGPAVAAGKLADRMEDRGVPKVIPYNRKRALPSLKPLTLDIAVDLEDISDEELDTFSRDIHVGKTG